MNERVMNVAKWSRNVSMSIVLGIFLAGCGDDDSSFAPHDEDSSSSVCEDCDESSSSVILSGDSHEGSCSSSEKSSSSRENDKSSSSEKVESSSSDKIVSSSSEKSSSSSSAKSSSSSIASSSSSVKSSSSSVKSSSSVVSSSSKDVASSSSEYVPYDHLIDMGDGVGTHVKKQDYKTFTDERNGRSYYYITIRGKNKAGEADSVTVMAENLNIGKMITYVKDQADDTTIERYCYDRDTTNCDRYGALYQWAEMMQLPSRCNTESCADLIQPNHQGICPEGWRLLTRDDFYIVLKSENAEHGIEDVRARGFGGYNYTGYSLVGAGYVWNRKLEDLGKGTYWFYPEEDSSNPEKKVPADASGSSSQSLINDVVAKTHGFSVRCVKLEE